MSTATIPKITDGQQAYRNLAAAVLQAAVDDRPSLDRRVRYFDSVANCQQWVEDFIQDNKKRLEGKHRADWRRDRAARSRLLLSISRHAIASVKTGQEAGIYDSKKCRALQSDVRQLLTPIRKEITDEKYKPLTKAKLRAIARTALDARIRSLRYSIDQIDDLFAGPSLWSDLLGMSFEGLKK